MRNIRFSLNFHVVAGIKFVESQQDFVNVGTNTVLRSNPRNTEFYAPFDSVPQVFQSIINNPQPTAINFQQSVKNFIEPQQNEIQN